MKLLQVLLLFICGAAVAEPLQVFQHASPNYRMEFPRDHGSHPNFQTEWWYYTGQLVGMPKELFRDSADFGFQLTFFRRAERTQDRLPWDEGFLAHAALLDLSKGTFTHEKRVASAGLGMAGAAEGMLQVWNRDWRLHGSEGKHVLEFNLEKGTVKVSLEAEYSGTPILHGEQGYSRKGQCETCASQYYSMPGMRIQGTLEVAGRITPLHGLAWMDHEFMSNSLQEDQSGWDWFSLMFKDGRRLMLYVLRRKDGGISHASGTLVEDGRARPLLMNDFSIEALSMWKSPRGTAYPASWQVKVPGMKIDEIILPLFANQEIGADEKSTISYWEGAVKSKSGDAIGYVELTGYEQELGGKF